MKKLTVALIVAASAFVGTANAGIAYEVVPRGNNVFLFCSKGMPEHGWVPEDSRRGTWRAIVKKKFVNRQWIPTYERVCSVDNQVAKPGSEVNPKQAL